MGIVDDILVTGSTEEEHDTAMTEVLKRTKENQTGFNPDKLLYKQKRDNFFDHTITEHSILLTEDKLEAMNSPKCKRSPYADGNDYIPQ